MNLNKNFENGRQNGGFNENERNVQRDEQHTKHHHTVRMIELPVPLASQAVVISGTVTE